VRIAIRKEATGQWLQADGSFGPTFRLHEANLSARGAAFTAWSWTRALAPAQYGLSVRAVSATGVVETSTPWLVFSVRA
jgi:hypothetical protein